MNMNEENFFQKFTGSLTVENLSERVEWLIILRWIAGVSVLVVLLSARAFFEIHRIGVPLVLGSSILIYNLIFLVVKKYFMTHPATSKKDINRRITFINLQVMMDLVVLAILIYYTGGIANPFISFFIFHMVISSILLSRGKAYFWAVFTILLEGMLFYLELFHYIPHQPFLPGYPEAMVENGDYVLFIWTAFTITLLITVYFATSIMRPIRKRQLDLTELQERLKHKRNLLEQRNKELSDMDRSKTEFLYRVEHELKAPIGALQSLIFVVRNDYSSVDEEKKKELLTRAENRVNTMKELVNDLLSLSRVSERRFKLELIQLNPEKIIQEVIQDLESYSQKKQIPIILTVTNSIPDIWGDRLAIIEIFRNIIQNAVKYSLQGEVTVNLSQVDQKVVVFVQDRGIGISEEDLHLIFKEFFRTANAKAFEEGSGLGLSLVKRLVERHGGNISISSQLNHGTGVTIALPINKKDFDVQEVNFKIPEFKNGGHDEDEGEPDDKID